MFSGESEWKAQICLKKLHPVKEMPISAVYKNINSLFDYGQEISERRREHGH